jgi:hypothetical protein
MSEELQQAAKSIQQQVKDGLRPNVGSCVLLVAPDGGSTMALGFSTNMTREAITRALEEVLAELKGRIVLPSGGGIVGRA